MLLLGTRAKGKMRGAGGGTSVTIRERWQVVLAIVVLLSQSAQGLPPRRMTSDCKNISCPSGWSKKEVKTANSLCEGDSCTAGKKNTVEPVGAGCCIAMAAAVPATVATTAVYATAASAVSPASAPATRSLGKNWQLLPHSC